CKEDEKTVIPKQQLETLAGKGSSLKSNDDSISGNKEDASSIAAKTHDIKRKMLEGKLVLVGDDGVLVKPLCESSTVLDFGLMSHIAISIEHHVEVPKSCEGGVVQTKSMADLIVSSKDHNVEHVNVDGQASAKHSSEVSPKTSSKDGMDTMLENDSWLIRNVLLTLEKWSPNANLMKEGVCNVLIRVKFYDVPITAFMEDGLSVIATKLGTILMLDSYTSTMCTKSWGKPSYARAMIELRADTELKDTLVVVLPKIKDDGYTLSTIRIEYAWKPPGCSSCKVLVTSWMSVLRKSS
ncbi:hypothetical protein Tco_1291064, partial [Tanacetum coccineum]